jgi:hypothetical protein
MKKANLVSMPTLVESPFIIVTIGGYTFGSFSGNHVATGEHTNVDFPNYMKSMSVTKVNGTVNTYTLSFSYQVAYGDDPNKLDKVFSRATIDRKITLSYGDWNYPSSIYKEETGIITNVTSSLNMSNSSIDYTVKCTSDAIGLTASKFTFPAQEAKPSEVIKDLVTNVRYGLQQVFTGMQDMGKVLDNGLIASNDKKVQLNMQKNVSPLEYLGYLVNSMVDNRHQDDTQLPDSKYFLTIHDDTTNDMGGTYFKVTEVGGSTAGESNSADTYELDVNFPTDNFITQFSLNNDQSWAILYEYSNEIKQSNYSYKMNGEGQIITTYSPPMLRSSATGGISPAESTWWGLMTGFPIQATLTLKGLTRPSILMTYVKLNVWFHGGVKHISSGLYIITKQEDKLDSSGYKTTLSLTRVGEDA